MRCASLLALLLCIFECSSFALAICTANKLQGGITNRLQCSNATLQTVTTQTADVFALIIFDSDLRYIPDRAFARFAKDLQSLNVHRCHVNEIHPEAFNTLVNLRKLSLPNNNLTRVKVAWFKDLVHLEMLDLSFNQISTIEPAAFSRIPFLKALNVRENRLTCLDPLPLPSGIDKLYIEGNPLTFQCRGKLTLWMRDHGVRYKTELSEKEDWLDKTLWLCAIGDPSVAKSEDLLKECVILNLFNQLRSGLSTAQSYPLITDCVAHRNLLTDCIVAEAQRSHVPTNGDVIKKLLLYIHQAKSTI